MLLDPFAEQGTANVGQRLGIDFPGGGAPPDPQADDPAARSGLRQLSDSLVAR